MSEGKRTARYLMALDPKRKREWVKAAKRERLTLAEWIRRTCDLALTIPPVGPRSIVK